MKLIFLGPPGAGKGTQAARIAAACDVAHISTGDMLRTQMRAGTPLGKAAQAVIARGELVGDEIIVAMVEQRIAMEDCKNGFLFDGFPRTLAQADALAAITPIDAVINIDVPSERLIGRISGRRMCPDCGSAYHVDTHASEACACGGKLYQRDDDKAETVANRVRIYEEQTQPLIDYYSRQGLLSTVNGDDEIDNVTAAIRKALAV